MSVGYVKIHRDLVDHELWLKSPFTDGQAWVDLIMLANHKTGWIYSRGIRMDVERGQVGWSILSLSKRWRWDRSTVKKFLTFLQQQKMIKIQQQNNHITTIISICNYDKWQSGSATESATESATNPATAQQQNQQQRNTNKKNKECKEELHAVPEERLTWMTPFFNAWQEIYLGEMNCGKWAKVLNKRIKSDGQDKTLAHFKNFLSSTEVDFAFTAKFDESFGMWSVPTAKLFSSKPVPAQPKPTGDLSGTAEIYEDEDGVLRGRAVEKTENQNVPF